jgi:hypothetical protein
LAQVSTEIQHLSDQSFTMNIQLKNRQVILSLQDMFTMKYLEAKLGSFVEVNVLTPNLIKSICENDVNEAYIDSLETLTQLIKTANQNLQQKEGTISLKETQPQLEKLKSKANFSKNFLTSKGCC